MRAPRLVPVLVPLFWWGRMSRLPTLQLLDRAGCAVGKYVIGAGRATSYARTGR